MLSGYLQMKQISFCTADNKFISYPRTPCKLKIVPTTTTAKSTPSSTTITNTGNFTEKSSDTLPRYIKQSVGLPLIRD